jgi:hypothetical protein
MNWKKVHIGKLIQTFIKENHINVAQLARDIHKTRQNLYDVYKREDIEVKLLLAISDALKHNFMEDICPTKKNNDVDLVVDALKELITEKIKEKNLHKLE